MRKNFFIAAVLAGGLFSNSIFAQIPGVSTVTKLVPEPIFGIKVGANFNELSTSATDMVQNYKAGISPGIFGGLRKGKWGVRAEVLVNFANYDYTVNGVKAGTFNNLYLDIPVMLEYKLFWRLWAQGGLQFSRTLNSSTTSSSITNPNDYFQKNSYSGVLGAELRLPVHLTFGARYVLGFTDLNTGTTGATSAWKARTAQVYLGFRFL